MRLSSGWLHGRVRSVRTYRTVHGRSVCFSVRMLYLIKKSIKKKKTTTTTPHDLAAKRKQKKTKPGQAAEGVQPVAPQGALLPLRQGGARRGDRGEGAVTLPPSVHVEIGTDQREPPPGPRPAFSPALCSPGPEAEGRRYPERLMSPQEWAQIPHLPPRCAVLATRGRV